MNCRGLKVWLRVWNFDRHWRAQWVNPSAEGCVWNKVRRKHTLKSYINVKKKLCRNMPRGGIAASWEKAWEGVSVVPWDGLASIPTHVPTSYPVFPGFSIVLKGFIRRNLCTLSFRLTPVHLAHSTLEKKLKDISVSGSNDLHYSVFPLLSSINRSSTFCVQ